MNRMWCGARARTPDVPLGFDGAELKVLGINGELVT